MSSLKKVVVTGIAFTSLQGCGKGKSEPPSDQNEKLPIDEKEEKEAEGTYGQGTAEADNEGPKNNRPDEAGENREKEVQAGAGINKANPKGLYGDVSDVVGKNKGLVAGALATAAALVVGGHQVKKYRAQAGNTCTAVGEGLAESLLSRRFKDGEVINVVCSDGYEIINNDVKAMCEKDETRVSACAKPNFLRRHWKKLFMGVALVIILFFMSEKKDVEKIESVEEVTSEANESKNVVEETESVEEVTSEAIVSKNFVEETDSKPLKKSKSAPLMSDNGPAKEDVEEDKIEDITEVTSETDIVEAKQNLQDPSEKLQVNPPSELGRTSSPRLVATTDADHLNDSVKETKRKSAILDQKVQVEETEDGAQDQDSATSNQKPIIDAEKSNDYQDASIQDQDAALKALIKVDLNSYHSVPELAQKVPIETMINDLKALGLECDGTAEQKALRLFLCKTMTIKEIKEVDPYSYQSLQELATKVPRATMGKALTAIGFSAGGTPEQQAQRLFPLKTQTFDAVPNKFKVKGQNTNAARK